MKQLKKEKNFGDRIKGNYHFRRNKREKKRKANDLFVFCFDLYPFNAGTG